MMGFGLKVGEIVLYGGTMTTGANTVVQEICIPAMTSPHIEKLCILLQSYYKYCDWPFLEQTARLRLHCESS